jgi:hypothetical protein
MKMWKLLGLAGVAGVAATGAVIVRSERRREQLTPDDVRGRLQERYEKAAAATPVPGERAGTDSAERRHRARAAWQRVARSWSRRNG